MIFGMRAALTAVCGIIAGCASSTPPRPETAPMSGDPVERVLPLAREAAVRHGVEAALILGVIQVESSFNPDARSSAGARGLMQLMPRTARSLARRLDREAYEITDPEFNVEAGTAYLAYLLRFFDGRVHLALAGYNSGPTRVLRWVEAGRDLPDYSRRYVAAVLAARDGFAARLAALPAGVGGATRGGGVETAQRGADTGLDRKGLRALVEKQRALYGDRPDEALPGEQPGLPAAVDRGE
jgi:hypothetical protein